MLTTLSTAFDLESMMTSGMADRKLDDEDRCTVFTRKERKTTHLANLIMAKDIFSDTWIISKTLDEFIDELEKDDGNHILFAHNASGYDSRFIFSAFSKRGKKPDIPLFRGNKIMFLSYKKIKFRDSLLHLQGSLANLAREYGLPEELQKG